MDIHFPKFRHAAHQGSGGGHRIHWWLLFLVLIALLLVAIGSAGI